MNSAIFLYFVLPFLIGTIIRLMFLKWKKGYLLSGVFILISIIAWLWTSHLVNHGTDGTLLLWAVMATEFTAGSLMTDGISLSIKKAKHRKADKLF
ncbi:MAG: hypothetical protein IKC24_04020 [Oscillospiraceae bacterium]|nr:hypothetical protein [Oscillospiraceae bacterium]